VDDSLVSAFAKDADPVGIDPEYFYLLGLLQASSGKPEEARRSLLAGLEVDELSLADAKPWILLAKIQEQYGLADAADASRTFAKGRPRKDDRSEWVLSVH
jgi:hypothetical protein